MQQKPILYCSVGSESLKTKILEGNRNLDFWEITFEEDSAFDVGLHYYEKTIEIKGIKTGVRMTTDVESILNQISPLDLSYIEQLFDDAKEQSEILDLVKREFKVNLEELIEAVHKQDADNIKNFAHKITSKLLVLSIPVLEQCRYVEQHATEFGTTVFQENYHLLKMYCLIRLTQINAL